MTVNVSGQGICGDDLDLMRHAHWSPRPGEPAFLSGPFVQIMYGLARFSGAKVIVELGISIGSTATIFAQAAALNDGMAYGVDLLHTHQADALSRLQRMGLDANWTFIQGNTAEVGRNWDRGPVNFLFVDAGHDVKDVKDDLTAWMPCMAPGGFVCCHDYSDEGYGVGEVVDAFMAVDANGEWECLTLPWGYGMAILRHKEGAAK
ncbi:class I SAM-dependent methyltransferase [bacterium]|nr:class I SAM-dependent methyltransferase [bacterium]